jgi:hypothetical protein
MLIIFCLRVRVKLFEAIYLSVGIFSYNKPFNDAFGSKGRKGRKGEK